MQLLPNEKRAVVVVGARLGHTDLHVSFEGTPGQVTIPIDVVAQAPVP